MKKLWIIAMLAAGVAGLLHADEAVELLKTTGSVTGGKIQIRVMPDKSISAKAPVNYQVRYGYMVVRVAVKPFKLAGKSLSLEVRHNTIPGDQFYVKAVNAKNQNVASFRTVKNLSRWNTMICTPGNKNGGVEYFSNDVKGDPEKDDVTALVFFFGRRSKQPAFESELRNIKLVPRTNSSVMTKTMTEPGKIELLRIIGCGVKDGKTTSSLAADGTLKIAAPVNYQNYNYMIANIETAPFLIAGNSLSFQVKSGNHSKGDSFYIKGYDINNKVVFSFYTTRNITNWTDIVCTPGSNSGNVNYIPLQVEAPENNPVVRIQIFCGRPGPGKNMEFEMKDWQLIKRPAGPVAFSAKPADGQKKAAEKFKLYGLGIPSAEVRNLIACTDKNGRKIVICPPLDEGESYILLTELDTGKSFQYYTGVRGAAYGGIMTDDGKFVYGVYGRTIIFDINTRKVTLGGGCVGAVLCAAISPDGKVYLSGAPQTSFSVVDPQTGESRQLGRLDDVEHYTSKMAVDKKGVLYAGIGTARANIIAYDPATGKRTQLLPENLRKLGSANVTLGTDGYVYAEFDGFSAKCLGGKVVATGVRCPEAKELKAVKYGTRLNKFADGTIITAYDLGKREMIVRENNGKIRKIKLEYVSGGLNLTSMAAGPDGNVYFSSSHPHHLGRLDVASGKIIDLGHNPRIGGGNMCNMTAYKGKLYGCEYALGRLWVYDPALPARYVSSEVVNFGPEISELLSVASVMNGTWSNLSKPNVLFGRSGDDKNEFTLNLPVPSPGKWFVNLQFYEADSYGTVTVKVAGKEYTYNLQNNRNAAAPIYNLGPFDLKDKYCRVDFNIRRNANSSSNNYFSLIGIEVAQKARIKEKDADSGVKNPEVLGRWANLVTRPRTVAIDPVSEDAVIAGFANYGMVGGGFGICNLKTGKTREISDWSNGESCIDMYFQKDGKLVGVTSTEAPGGGHVKAKCASVFRMDWKTGKVDRKIEIAGVQNIFGVREFGKYIYAAAQDGLLYQIDKEKWQLTNKFRTPGGTLGRNPLLLSADGKRLFLLQNRAISEIDPASGRPCMLVKTPYNLTAGGAIIGSKIYFIQKEKIGSWDFAEL